MLQVTQMDYSGAIILVRNTLQFFVHTLETKYKVSNLMIRIEKEIAKHLSADKRLHASKLRFYQCVTNLGGEVIGEYKNASTPVKCRCPNGHESTQKPSDVIRINKIRCKKCAGQDPQTAKLEFHERVKNLGGTVVGQYKNAGTSVECICPNGHRCDPTPSHVQRRNTMGCHHCSKPVSQASEAEFRERVTNLGGKVIGEYKGVNVPVNCICPLDHECNPYPSDVKRTGRIACPSCLEHTPDLAEAEFYERVKNLGGTVIGKYQGSRIPVKCLCPEGHECAPTPSYMRQKNSFCCTQCVRQCSKTAELRFVNHIKDLGGEVIGKYQSWDKPILCRCSKGHEYMTTPHHVASNNSLGCTQCSRNGYSQRALTWLKRIMTDEKINIVHAENGGEHKFPGTKLKADGYCKETNTVYEFHGCVWHGCPICYHEDDYNPIIKKTYKTLYENTIKKEDWIRAQGYNLVTIWEHEFKESSRTITIDCII